MSGWAAFYEAAEEGRDWIAEQDRAKAEFEAREMERLKQRAFQLRTEKLLRRLLAEGRLRDDRLSYVRICQLEWETGLMPGSWSDYHEALCEAERRDKSP